MKHSNRQRLVSLLLALGLLASPLSTPLAWAQEPAADAQVILEEAASAAVTSEPAEAPTAAPEAPAPTASGETAPTETPEVATPDTAQTGETTEAPLPAQTPEPVQPTDTPEAAQTPEAAESPETAETAETAALLDAAQRAADGGGHLSPINQEFLDWQGSGGYGLRPSMQDMRYLAQSYAELPATYALEVLPAQFDLRETGQVGPVRNQGIYGTCWAFASTTAAASALYGQFPGLTLSPAHLAWYTYVGQEESELYRDIIQAPVFDTGGYNTASAGTFAAWKGPVRESTLPYETVDELGGDLSSLGDSLRSSADFHLQDAFTLPCAPYNSAGPYLDSAPIKQLLCEYGAIDVFYYADDAYLDPDTNAYFCPDSSYTNHAVTLIGWDDDYSVENFNANARPQAPGAWLIQNSWDNDWGNEGTFWLSYEDATLTFNALYLLEDADNYDKNYQYDPVGWMLSLTAQDFYGTWNDETANQADKSSYMANQFTAVSAEQLEAVSFYTTDLGTEYELWVYTDGQADQPCSGTLAYSMTGTELYPGYHTIELDQVVPLQAGQRFELVVRLQNPSYPYPIPVEVEFIRNNDATPVYGGSGGESYVSADGTSWHDVVECGFILDDNAYCPTNVCLKGFTTLRQADAEPLPTVRFLQADRGESTGAQPTLLQGPVTDGTLLALSGPEQIRYRINDGPEQAYTGPIALDTAGGPQSVTAWGVDENGSGPARTVTYTQTAALLVDLSLRTPGGTQVVTVQNEDLSPITQLPLTGWEPGMSLELKPSANGTILLADGTQLPSGSWTAVTPDENGRLTLTVSAQGMTGATYTLAQPQAEPETPYTIDYEAETITYDSTAYTLSTQAGALLESGSSLTPYITLSSEEPVTLLLTPTAPEGEVEQIAVPQRSVLPQDPVDFSQERTYYTYFSRNEYRYEGEETWTTCAGQTFDLPLGTQLHLRRRASNLLQQLQGPELVIQIPEQRRPAPDAVVEETAAASVLLQAIEGAEYRLAEGEWQSSPLFDDLTYDTDYTFEVRLAAQEDPGLPDGSQPYAQEYVSETATLTAHTTPGRYLPLYLVSNGVRTLQTGCWLSLGENDVTPNDAFLVRNGLQLLGQSVTTVTLTEQDGVLCPSVDSAELYVAPADGSQPQDHPFTVQFYDEAGQRLPGADGALHYAPTHLYGISGRELPLPEGWYLAENSTGYIASLNYNDVSDLWYVSPDPAQVQLTRTAPTPTDPPSAEDYYTLALPGLEEALTDALYEAGFNSVSKLENALRLALQKQLTAPSAALDGLQTYQVQLYTLEGVPVPEEEYPAGLTGLTVVLPYPAGVNADDYDFYAVHMFGVAGQGHTVGQIEALSGIRTEQGLAVQVDSLSPFALGWVKKHHSSNDGGSAAVTATAAPTATPQSTAAQTRSLLAPGTGDAGPAPLLSLLLLGLAALALTHRKKPDQH